MQVISTLGEFVYSGALLGVTKTAATGGLTSLSYVYAYTRMCAYKHLSNNTNKIVNTLLRHNDYIHMFVTLF